MKLNISNEYNKLNTLLLAPVEEEYLEQQKELTSILEKYNVKVYTSDKVKNAKYQMFIRDPFIVIDNKLIISYMKEDIRKLEIDSINKLLKDINKEDVIFLDDDVIIEGGDILIHNDIIYVGQNGNRTNKKGLEYLKKVFGNKYKVIELKMINPSKYMDWVHLDCLFNILDDNTIIMYENGFEKSSIQLIESSFPNIVYINDKEQDELVANIFNLGNKTVIMQKRHTRLIKKIKSLGFNIELMDKYETIKETGYIRCLTCPLERD